MTFSELRKKDIICVGDGRLIGRAADAAFDVSSGRLVSLIVGGGGLCGVLHGAKDPIVIPFSQIVCIGDDVILVNNVLIGG